MKLFGLNISKGSDGAASPRSSLRGQAKTVIRASIDNADSLRNANHWTRATGAGADTVFDAHTRRTVRNNARYEVSNNAYARGAVDGLVDGLIGTGPRLQVVPVNQSDDGSRFAAELEDAWNEWCEEIGLCDKIAMMAESEIVSGEVFAVFRTDLDLDSVVKLDLDIVECDRVENDSAFKKVVPESNQYEIDGIIINRASGKPVSYRILRDHPGETTKTYMTTQAESDKVDASNVIHWFRASRPGQTRGISRLTPSLELFALLRRYTLSVVEAAETAASWAGVLKTDTPAGGEADDIDPLDVIDLEHRSLLTLPAGWEMQQMDARQPTATYEMFKRELLTEIGRALGMPANVITGDSSDYNYASGRLDHQSYHKLIRNDRKRIERVILARIFSRFYEQWRRVMYPGTDTKAFKYQWMWDGFGHVDPVKEANAQAQRLRSSTTTLAEECAAEGRDWEQVLAQRGREIEKMKELGIPLEGQPPQAEGDEEDSRDKERNRANPDS